MLKDALLPDIARVGSVELDNVRTFGSVELPAFAIGALVMTCGSELMVLSKRSCKLTRRDTHIVVLGFVETYECELSARNRLVPSVAPWLGY